MSSDDKEQSVMDGLLYVLLGAFTFILFVGFVYFLLVTAHVLYDSLDAWADIQFYIGAVAGALLTIGCIFCYAAYSAITKLVRG